MKTRHKITDISGQAVDVECLSCAIVNRQVQMRGEAVLRTDHFDVHQDYEIPIPGFMILASMRHLLSVDEFTTAERLDFMDSLIKVRSALRQVLGIKFVYLIQEEDTSAHFHLWIFPRYDWMNEQFGHKLQSVRPIMEYAREHLKTPENIDELDRVITALRSHIASKS